MMFERTVKTLFRKAGLDISRAEADNDDAL